MTKVKFTGKVGAKHMSFLKKGTKELHSAWYSMAETTDGEMVVIKDKTAPFELMEAETRYKAIKKAEEYLERVGLE